MFEYRCENFIVLQIKRSDCEDSFRLLTETLFPPITDWRYSSDITQISKDGPLLSIKTRSGSCYLAYEDSEFISNKTRPVFDQLSKEAQILSIGIDVVLIAKIKTKAPWLFKMKAICNKWLKVCFF